MIPDKRLLEEAFARLKGHIHHTPVLRSRQIDELCGAQLYFKCENFQQMGAFKMRGALNAILSLSDKERSKGVVTHSSGNFAQAVALAASKTNTAAHIVMPENAPSVKVAAVRGYGGVIYQSGNSPSDREEMARQVMAKTGASFIHPSNQLEVILGNSTASIELLDSHPDLEIIVAPVGGGGLIAGTALAAKYFSQDCQVFGAEPTGAGDAYMSIREGRIVPSVSPDTICDGLRTQLGDINFPIIQSEVTDILLVEDRVTIEALKLLLTRMKIVTEPSAAITLGAILSHKAVFAGKKVGIIISGGNVELDRILCQGKAD